MWGAVAMVVKNSMAPEQQFVGNFSQPWHLTLGCTPISEGCRNCYAARDGVRGGWWTKKVRFLRERLDDPLSWPKQQLCFVNSNSDLFHPDVPDDFIREAFNTMNTAHMNNLGHIFSIVTRYAARLADLVSRYKLAGDPPWSGTWFGLSVENQRWADERLPYFREFQAATKYACYGPMLEQIDFSPFLDCLNSVLMVPERDSKENVRHPAQAWVQQVRKTFHDAGKSVFWTDPRPAQSGGREFPLSVEVQNGGKEQEHRIATD